MNDHEMRKKLDQKAKGGFKDDATHPA
jgi:hypothetical protein